MEPVAAIQIEALPYDFGYCHMMLQLICRETFPATTKPPIVSLSLASAAVLATGPSTLAHHGCYLPETRSCTHYGSDMQTPVGEAFEIVVQYPICPASLRG